MAQFSTNKMTTESNPAAIKNPYLVGGFVGLVLVVSLVIMAICVPSSEDFLSHNKVWIQLGAYTATLVLWLLTSLRPRRVGIVFWTFVVVVLTIHTACFIAFILFVRPIGPIHYIVFGPLEGL